jgi:SAM-dependent methyltransferase
MSNPVWLDEPQPGVLRTPLAYLRGWTAVADPGGEMEVRIGEHKVDCARVPRPDLQGHPHFGFAIFLDLLNLHERRGVRPGPLSLGICAGGQAVATVNVMVDAEALQGLDDLIANRSFRRRFVRENCNTPLEALPGCKAPSALPDGWPIDPTMAAKTDAVSAHFYGQPIHDFLNSLGPDAVILDAGAGFRAAPRRNVVHLEIYDYPSTDVLGIGQKLPFRDGVFDGALSLAVLEHVDDPFQCARELLRVVKPGGRIMAIVPFLQAEHGYPSHYFNCTRFGLQRLFSAARVVDHFLEISNQPIHTLNQILGTYASGLPTKVRERFLNMTVRDFANRSAYDYIIQNDDLVTKLDEEAAWKIAWGTTAIFEKPARVGAGGKDAYYPPGFNWFEDERPVVRTAAKKAGAPLPPPRSRGKVHRAIQILRENGLGELCRRVVRKCVNTLLPRKR